jgi:uncharacterized membrane protein YcjF (UPF0283 family)
VNQPNHQGDEVDSELEASRQPRRTFLKQVAGAIAAFIGIVVSLPAIAYLGAPLAR